MPVLDVIQHALISAVIAYLSFTNSLAVHIESFFSPTSVQDDTTLVSAPTDTSTNVFDTIAQEKLVPNSFSRILLHHAEYQRAAVLASSDTDTEELTREEKPLTETVLDALVNIYCQYKTDKYIRTTTGTGFFINPKGVILTNAHVAQFLLLEHTEGINGSVECVIRTGNPAKPQYLAELLFISPTWVFENSTVISEESPQGTGERDYALLYIAKSVDSTPLPMYFPTLPVDTALLPRSTEGTTVLTAGYPAEELMRKGADARLASVIASTTVGILYTFGSNYADLFSISASPVGEHGASGGPIVHTESKDAIGLIVTKGDTAREGEHSLRALTLSYIDRTMQEETGFSLAQNMQGDIAYRGAIFHKAMAPFLAGILAETLAQ